MTRYGGVEFISIMLNTSLDDAYVLTEGIRQMLEKTKIKVNQNEFINITINADIAEAGIAEAGIADSSVAIKK